MIALEDRAPPIARTSEQELAHVLNSLIEIVDQDS